MLPQPQQSSLCSILFLISLFLLKMPSLEFVGMILRNLNNPNALKFYILSLNWISINSISEEFLTSIILMFFLTLLTCELTVPGDEVVHWIIYFINNSTLGRVVHVLMFPVQCCLCCSKAAHWNALCESAQDKLITLELGSWWWGY